MKFYKPIEDVLLSAVRSARRTPGRQVTSTTSEYWAELVNAGREAVSDADDLDDRIRLTKLIEELEGQISSSAASS